MNVNLSQLNLFWTLAKLTALRVLKRRSTWFFLILGLLPCAIFLFWVLANVSGSVPATKPYGIFLHIQSLYLLSFYLPLLAIFLGLGVISDEIETKNITFTLVRPLNRLAIVLGRFVGHLLVAFALVVIALVGSYFSNMLFQIEDFARKIPNLINGAFVLCFGITAYLGVVAAFGTLLKRFAILLAIFWALIDAFFSVLPVNTLKAISVKYRMLSSYSESLPQFTMSFTDIAQTSAFINAFVCLFFAVIACLVMTWRISAFEIVLSDGSN